jgi:hypothetical protein
MIPALGAGFSFSTTALSQVADAARARPAGGAGAEALYVEKMSD